MRISCCVFGIAVLTFATVLFYIQLDPHAGGYSQKFIESAFINTGTDEIKTALSGSRDVVIIAVILALLTGVVLLSFIVIKQRSSNRQCAGVETLAARHDKTLAEQNNLLQALIQTFPGPLFYKNEQGKFLGCNRHFEQMSGLSENEIAGKPVFDVLPASMADIYYKLELELITKGQHAGTESRVRFVDGSYHDMWFHQAVFHKADGNPGGHIAIALDFTSRKSAEEGRRKLSEAIRQSSVAIIIFDVLGRINYVNPRFTELTGYLEKQLLGQTTAILKDFPLSTDLFSTPWRHARHSTAWQGECKQKRRDGSLYWLKYSLSAIRGVNEELTHYLFIGEDITQQKANENCLLRQATIDEVTGLANRRLAQDRLKHGLARARRNSETVALLFIDLDRFKQINDTLGHAGGDQLLLQAGQRISSCVRASDTVARLSGDEFMVLLQNVHTDAENVARHITEVLIQPFFINDHEVFTSASIGLTLYPDHGETPKILMQNADAALYQAKSEGRNGFHLFSAALNARIMERAAIERELRGALAAGEFELFYQPLMDLNSGRLSGAEALLRWQNPKLGRVPPDKFIAIAEDSGLIDSIGKWVLGTACQQVMAWRQCFRQPINIAVNMSSRQLRDTTLVAFIDTTLRDSGLPADGLELEITESLMMDPASNAIACLQQLEEMGISIAIDDFGTGYSSLQYIKQLPVHTVKIDRSFIEHLPHSEDDASLVRAIIAMAHSMDLKVVAEGIETSAHINYLRTLNCDRGQGFYFGKPVAAQEFEQFLIQSMPVATTINNPESQFSYG